MSRSGKWAGHSFIGIIYPIFQSLVRKQVYIPILEVPERKGIDRDIRIRVVLERNLYLRDHAVEDDRADLLGILLRSACRRDLIGMAAHRDGSVLIDRQLIDAGDLGDGLFLKRSSYRQCALDIRVVRQVLAV